MNIWLVADEAFEGRQRPIKEVLDELNIPCVCYKYNRNMFEYNSDEIIDFSKYSTVILYGPVQFIKRMSWSLYEWGINFYAYGYKNVNCTDYYGRYPLDWFFNPDISFVPFGLFRQRVERHFTNCNDKIFVRPNSSKKTFTGFVLESENFEQELKFVSKNLSIYDEDLIGYASFKDVGQEYRCWIVDGKLVDISFYSWDDDDGGICSFDEDEIIAKFLANKIASHEYQIDRAYTVDISVKDGIAKIIEFNSFCSAGFYRADMKKIIEKVNNIEH